MQSTESWPSFRENSTASFFESLETAEFNVPENNLDRHNFKIDFDDIFSDAIAYNAALWLLN